MGRLLPNGGITGADPCDADETRYVRDEQRFEFMRVFVGSLLITGLGLTSAAAQSGSVTTSLRPMARPEIRAPAVAPLVVSTAPMMRPVMRPVGLTLVSQVQPVKATDSFGAWRAGFRKRAVAQGIDPAVFDAAFKGVRFDRSIIALDRKQSEFTKQIWDYLNTAVSATRVRNGRAAARQYETALAAIEAKYGVDRAVLTAIWGLESAYGATRGKTPVIQSLATLAYDPRRSAFFEAELLAALTVLQSGEVKLAQMRGSWAGAMGHTQFMPISYLEHAQDFDGDGRRNIWGDSPVDALASAAAFLSEKGWTAGQPWGVEVTLPDGFNYGETTERVKKPTTYWVKRGVKAADGAQLPRYKRSSILLPAGHRGPAFMIFDNFHVLERYNTADAYVIGVGHLADRIAGGAVLQAKWPRADRPLSFSEKQEMQRRLRALGFDPAGVDGIIGPKTIAAVQDYQASVGAVPDGYPSARLLNRLRKDG